MEKSSALNGIDFSPEINMVRYLQKIRNYPILSQDEEYNLALKYRETKDKNIAKVLVTSHLRLVVKVVAKYRGYGLSSAEMISEGNIGLLYAVEKFEPEKGFRFSTYALWWIKASVQKYILNSWSLVKIGTTAAQKKLFFNLRKIKNKLNLNDDRDFTPEAIDKIAGLLDVSHQDVKDMNIRLKAHDGSLNMVIDSSGDSGSEWMDFIADSLDVSAQEVKDMNTRLKSHDGSLNMIIDSSGDGGSEWMDFIADSKPNQEDVFAYSETLKYRKKLFSKALVVLNKREKDILFKRRLFEKAITLDDLSKFYGISKERVRQIELNSIKKIKKAVELEI